ncbi:MAG: hypothetical protein ACTHMQ_08125 [Protaetiibacter sp.]
MIEAAVLLAVIGTADLVRALASRPGPSIVLGATVGIAVAVVGALVAGAAWWAAAAAVALLALWLWAMTPEPGEEPERIWPALTVLVAASIAAVGLPVAGAPHPAISDWYSATAPGAAGIAWTTAIVTLGVVLFLLRSTNLLVRAAINSRAAARASSASEAIARRALPSGAEGWRVRIGRRPVADLERVAASGRQAPQLVGGRVIGPIERLLLIGLGLAGGAAVIAALVAAKGVVRFPEISADRGTGANAETFLVGSLTSWAVAAGGALLIWGTLG